MLPGIGHAARAGLRDRPETTLVYRQLYTHLQSSIHNNERTGGTRINEERVSSALPTLSSSLLCVATRGRCRRSHHSSNAARVRISRGTVAGVCHGATATFAVADHGGEDVDVAQQWDGMSQYNNVVPLGTISAEVLRRQAAPVSTPVVLAAGAGLGVHHQQRRLFYEQTLSATWTG
jgi:hypothetical protein